MQQVENNLPSLLWTKTTYVISALLLGYYGTVPTRSWVLNPGCLCGLGGCCRGRGRHVTVPVPDLATLVLGFSVYALKFTTSAGFLFWYFIFWGVFGPFPMIFPYYLLRSPPSPQLQRALTTSSHPCQPYPWTLDLVTVP